MSVIIYHNPACGTSRNVLEMIRATGEDPKIIEYLKTPPSRSELENMVKRSGSTVRDLLRRKGSPYDELGLDDPKWSDSELLDLIVQHPVLLNRPVVVTPLGVRLCRPAEKLYEILDI
jgi:arsenate reductase (glutaredoxin)